IDPLAGTTEPYRGTMAGKPWYRRRSWQFAACGFAAIQLVAVLAVLRPWQRDPIEQTQPFQREKDMLMGIRDDLLRAPEADRRRMRYFVLTNLIPQRGEAEKGLRQTRIALVEAFGLLGEHPPYPANPVDDEQTVYRVDMRWFSRPAEAWSAVLQDYP